MRANKEGIFRAV